MRFHETAVNNYIGERAGRRHGQRNRSRARTPKFDVKLPEWMQKAWDQRKTEGTKDEAAANEPFQQYALKFRAGRPISVAFDG